MREKATRRAGVTAIEYALIAGLVAVAVVGVTIQLGGDVASLYQGAATEIAKIPSK